MDANEGESAHRHSRNSRQAFDVDFPHPCLSVPRPWDPWLSRFGGAHRFHLFLEHRGV